MSATSQDEVSLRDLLEILRRGKWVILAVPVLFAVAAGCISLFLPKTYEASIVVSSATDSAGRGGLGGLAGQLGGLASLAGLSASGGTGKDEAIAVLQSELLTERYVHDNNLLSVLLPDQQASAFLAWITFADNKPPTLWRANKKFKKIRQITEDRKTGLATLTIVWTNPQMAADWANGLVRTTNQLLRDKAIEESEQHIKYLSEQAAKTDMTQVRASMYSLLESEIKNVMQARGTSEYALRVIDPAAVPESKAGPKVLAWVAVGFFSGLVLSLVIAFLMSAFQSNGLSG